MPNDDMKVIGAIARKGGAGKTTLIRALISAVVADGHSCLALDADPQGALSRWDGRITGDRGRLIIKRVESTAELSAEIEAAYENGTADFVFIDTQGVGGEWIDEVAVQCDHVVTPLMLTFTDVDTALQTAAWYEDLKERASDPHLLPSHRMILARVPPRLTKGQREIATMAVERLPLLETALLERNQFQDMDTHGLLHELAAQMRAHKITVVRKNARLYEDALDEVRDILDEILGGTYGAAA